MIPYTLLLFSPIKASKIIILRNSLKHHIIFHYNNNLVCSGFVLFCSYSIIIIHTIIVSLSPKSQHYFPVSIQNNNRTFIWKCFIRDENNSIQIKSKRSMKYIPFEGKKMEIG